MVPAVGLSVAPVPIACTVRFGGDVPSFELLNGCEMRPKSLSARRSLWTMFVAGSPAICPAPQRQAHSSARSVAAATAVLFGVSSHA